MRQAHRDLTFRRGSICAPSFRLWWNLLLIIAISVWAVPGALASTVTPSEMTFQAVEGAGNPPSQTINVYKPNKHTTSWTASDNAGWITISPGSGSITDSIQVSVAVNTTGLVAGTYTATISIQVERGGNAAVPVTLTVAPAVTTSLSTTTPSTTTPSTSTSTTASLTWSAGTSSGVAGYNVYLGTASGVYGPPINVGNVTSYVVSNLSFGNTYYFVVTAYNTSGGESPPSNEVTKSLY